MLSLFAESLIGRLVKYTLTRVKVANSSNPIMIITNITLKVIDYCKPLLVRLIGHCIGASAAIGASIISPNPATIRSVVHPVTEIYEQC